MKGLMRPLSNLYSTPVFGHRPRTRTWIVCRFLIKLPVAIMRPIHTIYLLISSPVIKKRLTHENLNPGRPQEFHSHITMTRMCSRLDLIRVAATTLNRSTHRNDGGFCIGECKNRTYQDRSQQIYSLPRLLNALIRQLPWYLSCVSTFLLSPD